MSLCITSHDVSLKQSNLGVWPNTGKARVNWNNKLSVLSGNPILSLNTKFHAGLLTVITSGSFWGLLKMVAEYFVQLQAILYNLQLQ
jgi:hypothetical protein